MNQEWVLVGLSAVVLVAYLFDFACRLFRIPSVVVLLFVGMGLRAGADVLNWNLDLPTALLPILGTFGLILIVLEGALDLRLTRQATPLIARSALCAVLGVVLTGGLVAACMVFWLQAPVQAALTYAVPFAVISSAVAIPAAAALSQRLRDFVVYESSISDIVGVVIFYALLKEFSGLGPMLVTLAGELTLSVLVGLFVGLLIYMLIQRIDHHVRVLPMIFGITLLYGLGKLMSLSPLVMVLLVGLVLNNSQLLGKRLQSGPAYERDLVAFKHLNAEFTFAVRSFFFVLLGFSTAVPELLEPDAWAVAGFVVASSLVPRWFLLRFVAREKDEPLLWFAPRGLITVLLVLAIPAHLTVPGFPKAALMLVILIWALLLTYGSMRIPVESRAKNSLDESAPSEPQAGALS